MLNFLKFCATKEYTEDNQLSSCIARLITAASSTPTELFELFSCGLDSPHVDRRFALAVIAALDASATAGELSKNMLDNIYPSIIRLLRHEDLEVSCTIACMDINSLASRFKYFFSVIVLFMDS